MNIHTKEALGHAASAILSLLITAAFFYPVVNLVREAHRRDGMIDRIKEKRAANQVEK